MLELADIYNECFENKFDILREKIPKQSVLNEVNSFGEKSIYYYKQIMTFVQDEYNKSSEKTEDDFMTLITIKLNLARLYSKLIFNDIKKKVSTLAVSLRIYEDTYSNLKKSEFTGNSEALSDRLRICEEMINLLPIKIDKINNGIDI